MGHNARERVRGAFLGARHLEQYVDLFGESSVSASFGELLTRFAGLNLMAAEAWSAKLSA